MIADPDRQQCGDRVTRSISDNSQSLQDLNYIIDELEREEMESLSQDIMSNPDEELKVDWEVSGTPSMDNTIAPEVSSQPYLLESDLNISMDSISSPSPPSPNYFFPCNLTEASAFSIEKVLGPTTANILAEAEAEVSKYADGLQSLEIECSEDTNERQHIVTCQICQLFVRTVDQLLDKSEQLMDHYLPLTEEEIANLKKTVEELDDSTNDHEIRVCFARISNLLGKLRQRAYMISLSKLRIAQKNTEDNLARLDETIDLIGQVQRVDAMDYPTSFEKLTEISIQWCQRHSLQQQPMRLPIESFSPGSSIDEICPRHAQSSDIEDLGLTISISSKVEEKTPEIVPTFSTEIHYMEQIEVVPTEEVTPPPYVSSEKLPSPPAEVEPEAPPSPPEEVEPELPPGPPEEVEPEVPPSPPAEVEPEAPPSPPEEVEPEVLRGSPEEVEPEVPPSPPVEIEPEVLPSPPIEVEPEVLLSPPEEIEPVLLIPPEEVEPEILPTPPEEVEPELPPSPPAEVEPEVPPSPEVPTPPPEVEPEKPPTPPPEVEPEKPPTPPPEVEPEKPPTPPPEVEPEKPPTPPPEVEPEKPPTPPPEVEPEKPPTPPPEVEPEKPPTPPPEVEPEKPPTPPPEVEPEKPPTPPPEVEPEKPPTPPPEETVHKDVAHVTLTSPGCDEDLLLRMARSEEDFVPESLDNYRRFGGDRRMECSETGYIRQDAQGPQQ